MCYSISFLTVRCIGIKCHQANIAISTMGKNYVTLRYLKFSVHSEDEILCALIIDRVKFHSHPPLT